MIHFQSVPACLFRKYGFTLAELLIALAILGVIATFTIPKVLQSQQDGKYKSIAKEVAAMLAESFERYKQSNPVTNSTNGAQLTQYFNYVKADTSGTYDGSPGWQATFTCNGTDALGSCLVLHNGAVISASGNSFGATGGNNRVLEFILDPDGKQTGKQDSLWIQITYNGRIVTEGSQTGNYYYSGGCGGGCAPGNDPAWFSWN